MSVRADWHLTDLGDGSEELQALLDRGRVIDTFPTIPELMSELSALITKEGRYWEFADTSCDLKWQPRHRIVGGDALSCFACPMYTESRDEPRSLICALGRRQETIIEQMQAIDAAGTLEAELASAYGEEITMAMEMADVLL